MSSKFSLRILSLLAALMLLVSVVPFGMAVSAEDAADWTPADECDDSSRWSGEKNVSVAQKTADGNNYIQYTYTKGTEYTFGRAWYKYPDTLAGDGIRFYLEVPEDHPTDATHLQVKVYNYAQTGYTSDVKVYLTPGFKGYVDLPYADFTAEGNFVPEAGIQGFQLRLNYSHNSIGDVSKFTVNLDKFGFYSNSADSEVSVNPEDPATDLWTLIDDCDTISNWSAQHDVTVAQKASGDNNYIQYTFTKDKTSETYGRAWFTYSGTMKGDGIRFYLQVPDDHPAKATHMLVRLWDDKDGYTDDVKVPLTPGFKGYVDLPYAGFTALGGFVPQAGYNRGFRIRFTYSHNSIGDVAGFNVYLDKVGFYAHEYAYDCSKVCSSCEEETRPNADHSYDHDYDADCNYGCGETRDAEEVATPPFSHDGNSISEDVSGLGFKFTIDANNIAIAAGRTNLADYTNATVGNYKLVRMGAVVSNGVSEKDVNAKYLFECDEDTFASASFVVRVIGIPEANRDTPITATPYFVIENNGTEYTIYGEAVTSSYNAVLGLPENAAL